MPRMKSFSIDDIAEPNVATRAEKAHTYHMRRTHWMAAIMFVFLAWPFITYMLLGQYDLVIWVAYGAWMWGEYIQMRKKLLLTQIQDFRVMYQLWAKINAPKQEATGDEGSGS